MTTAKLCRAFALSQELCAAPHLLSFPVSPFDLATTSDSIEKIPTVPAIGKLRSV